MCAVRVIAILTAKSGNETALEALLKGMVAPSRGETGNVQYNLWQDATTDGRYVIDEIYQDDAANLDHRESAHFQNYLSVVNDLAERVVAVVTPIDVQL